MLWAVSRAPLGKLDAYKARMGWTFPWASSFGSDFNFDYGVGFTPRQQDEGYDYNFQEKPPIPGDAQGAPGGHAAMCGVDLRTYLKELPGMSASSSRTASSITPIRPMPEVLMRYGACIRGWTERRSAATKRARGGAAATNMAAFEGGGAEGLIRRRCRGRRRAGAAWSRQDAADIFAEDPSETAAPRRGTAPRPSSTRSRGRRCRRAWCATTMKPA